MPAMHADHGFSLIETLMVVVIVSLMAGVVVLNMPAGGDNLQDELGHAKAVHRALLRESVLSGVPYGLRYHETGYQVYRLAKGEWVAEADLVRDANAQWPNGVLSDVMVAGEHVLSDKLAGKALEGPHVWFLPTGEVADFSLRLQQDGFRGTLESDGSGHFQVRHEN